ncbi:MAG: hypothetical protein COA73_02765 [Candidatus Hydrogenedentota bacterium]|nr:MAG: hypothetical protein COA73_02765 [Candidatus Hydrogenedentota bacterium]
MSTRGTLLLAAICGALLFAYWGTGRIETERIQAQYESKKLFDDTLGEVTALTITLGDTEPVSAQRVEAGQWAVQLPHESIAANHPLWEQMAQAAGFLTNEREIDTQPEDLALYGLDAPLITVELVGASTNHILEFGKADPTQNNRYARLDEGPVFLIPSQQAELYYRTLDDLRDKRILSRMAEGIDRIKFIRHTVEQDEQSENNPQMQAINETFERDDSGKWHVTSPYEAVAHQEKVLNLVSHLQFGGASDFADSPENLSDYGLEPEWAIITAYNVETDEAQTLRLGWLDDSQENGGMYAMVDGAPTVFKVELDFVARLPNAPSDFREKRLFTGEVSNLTSIRYTDRNHAFTLTQDSIEGWKLTDPLYEDTDNLIVSLFLSHLKRIPGESFPPEADAVGLNPGRIRFDFTFLDGSSPTSIAVGGPVPDSDPMMFYARQDSGTVTTIPVVAIPFLQSKSFDFRHRRLMKFDPKDVVEIQLETNSIRYELERTEDRWAITVPENTALESQSDVTTLLEILAAVDAVDIADPRPAEDVMGLSSPTLLVRLMTKSGEGIGPFRIGDLTASSSRYRFVSVEGKKDVYFVDQGVLDDLREALSGIALAN